MQYSCTWWFMATCTATSLDNYDMLPLGDGKEEERLLHPEDLSKRYRGVGLTIQKHTKTSYKI